MEQQLLSSGHSFAQLRAASYFSPLHSYRERIGGLTYYQFLYDLEKNFEEKSGDISAKLKEAAEILFNRNAMRASITVEKNEFLAMNDSLIAFSRKIPAFEFKAVEFSFQAEQLNEGIIIPSQVQYVSKAGDFRREGGEYSGKLNVLTNIMRTGYLWNNIRVQGGAYGSGISIDRSGLVSFMSYRDPHLDRTVGIFDGAADAVANLELSELDLTKAIIATSGAMDRPTTPAEKGARAATRYLIGITQEEVQKERDDVLSTSLEDLRGFAEVFRKTMDQDNICVFGSEGKIESNKPLFKNVIRINP